MKNSIEELEPTKITDSVRTELEAKSQLLMYMGYSKAAKIYKEVSRKETMPKEFILDMSEEELEKASSKFVSPGLHVVEFGLPDWEQEGKTIKFPFIVAEEGEDSGKEGKMVTGIDKKSAWKMKEILKSAEITYRETKDGKVAFKPEDAAGKQCKILFKEQVDTRSAAEGGKGTKYTKGDTCYPMSTTAESLGI